MSLLSNLRQQPEGRRLEFKESLPTNFDLVKTVIAFANDAGGELYIGIKDNPREIDGLNLDRGFIQYT
ncbi:MAG: ATP-binding protein [Prolixibacteraceae bacterium]|jgi:ATP-dependent DNA helicase RecG